MTTVHENFPRCGLTERVFMVSTRVTLRNNQRYLSVRIVKMGRRHTIRMKMAPSLGSQRARLMECATAGCCISVTIQASRPYKPVHSKAIGSTP